MRLTHKDIEFLGMLRRMMEAKDLNVELRSGKPSYMVLRGTYGDHVQRAFHITRQGLRWRFQRVFNDVYVSAFETILFIETHFGTGLRDHAIRISKERYALREEIARLGCQSADRFNAADENAPPREG